MHPALSLGTADGCSDDAYCSCVLRFIGTDCRDFLETFRSLDNAYMCPEPTDYVAGKLLNVQWKYISNFQVFRCDITAIELHSPKKTPETVKNTSNMSCRERRVGLLFSCLCFCLFKSVQHCCVLTNCSDHTAKRILKKRVFVLYFNSVC